VDWIRNSQFDNVLRQDRITTPPNTHGTVGSGRASGVAVPECAHEGRAQRQRRQSYRLEALIHKDVTKRLSTDTDRFTKG